MAAKTKNVINTPSYHRIESTNQLEGVGQVQRKQLYAVYRCVIKGETNGSEKRTVQMGWSVVTLYKIDVYSIYKIISLLNDQLSEANVRFSVCNIQCSV